MNSTNVSALATMALFNITLNLELIIPQSENTTLLNITDNWNWTEIIGLRYKNISRDWLENVEIWYLPLMSTTAANQWTNYFTGKNISSNITADGNWSNFCGNQIWEDPIAILRGFNETQPVKCYTDKKIIGAWNCTYWSDKLKEPSKSSAVLSHTNNSSYIVEIRVWENQTKDWVVFSTEKVLSKEAREEVMHHLSEIGFDNPLDFVSVNYDKCPDLE